MEIGDWPSTEGLNEVYRQIRDLDLEKNIAELDTFGYTIVEPEKVATPAFIGRLRDKILDIVEERSGVRPDTETGATHTDILGPMESHYWLLFEDRVFEEALMNPVALALASYMVGPSCNLSVMSALMKGPGTMPLQLHTDNWGNGIPSPYPPYAQVCNTTYILSDYSKDNGALCFVPGSHSWHREPTPEESANFDRAVAVEAPAGSMVAWTGDQWHGAFPRTAPGLRLGMLMGFQRPYVRPFQPYERYVTKELLDRNPDRMGTLLGTKVFQGFEAEGPDHIKTYERATRLYD